MMSKGGMVMNYIKITEQIARENNTTAQEVENEMKKALEAAGISIDPEVFISLIAADIKKQGAFRRCT